VAGLYLVEFVALNDFNEPEEAIVQARKMEVDPGVLGVLGGWSPETAQVAAHEYERLGLAFLYPGVDFTDVQPSIAADAEFETAYKELSGGAAPGAAASWAYAEANRLLDALEASAETEDRPTRTTVQVALRPDSLIPNP
jgi:ABC-type branched-subunit amino acid transport system substrate-binding protein